MGSKKAGLKKSTKFTKSDFVYRDRAGKLFRVRKYRDQYLLFYWCFGWSYARYVKDSEELELMYSYTVSRSSVKNRSGNIPFL